MRIAVCDDEELFRIEFKSVLDKVLINAEYDIDTFSGGSSLYEAFLKNPFESLITFLFFILSSNSSSFFD